MPASMGTKFLDAAIEIGEYLADAAITGNGQISWSVFDKQTQTASDAYTNLYSGSSGIGLFLLELYKHTQSKTYLSVACRAILTAAAREKTRPVNPSFVCGRLGVAFALSKLYEVTGSKLYREQALALAKGCRQVYAHRQEYLNGNAGALLALLHIHAICQEPWLLQMVNDHADRLLRGVRPGPNGVYWDRGPFEVHPLCGFSHGTAGIGFVLLELGHYLENAAFYHLAQQAFAYENTYFDEAQGTWPDFRLKMWKPEDIASLETAYKDGNLTPFYMKNYMSAWCHGAPGIGLSRLYACQLTGGQSYRRDVRRAAKATKNALLTDISLCHGLAGNMDIFIESHLAFGRSSDLARSHAFGTQLVERWKQLHVASQRDGGQVSPLDPSLFTGIAGAGYNLLRLHDARLTLSIVAPRIHRTLSKKNAVIGLPVLGISRAGIQNLIKDDEGTGHIKHLKRHMMLQYPSDGLLYVKQRVAQKALLELRQRDDGQLLGCKLQLDLDSVLHLQSKDKAVLLTYTTHGIEQKSLSPFCYIVLRAFAQPQTVRDVTRLIGQQYGLAQSEAYLQAKVLEQTRQALDALVLLPV